MTYQDFNTLYDAVKDEAERNANIQAKDMLQAMTDAKLLSGTLWKQLLEDSRVGTVALAWAQTMGLLEDNNE